MYVVENNPSSGPLCCVAESRREIWENRSRKKKYAEFAFLPCVWREFFIKMYNVKEAHVPSGQMDGLRHLRSECIFCCCYEPLGCNSQFLAASSMPKHRIHSQPRAPVSMHCIQIVLTSSFSSWRVSMMASTDASRVGRAKWDELKIHCYNTNIVIWARSALQ